jgi:sulfopyruvate decarboxylase TPP-binding subunit
MRIDEITKELSACCDWFVGVPDSRIAPVIDDAIRRGIYHPARSEEIAVAMAFGARLGGARPCVVMQDKGLGRSVQALYDLHRLYKVGVVVLVSNRCHEDEEPQDKAWAKVPRRIVDSLFDGCFYGRAVDAAEQAFSREQIAFLIYRAPGPGGS